MATDAWGIDDGWVDGAGRWQAARSATIDAIRDVLGPPSAGRPLWVVRPGVAEPLLSPCRLVLEDATDLGDLDRLPPDLPLGLHDLVPLDGGPTTTLLVGPGRCHVPDGPPAWGVTVQVPTARSRASWGIGDLHDVATVARWLGGLGASVIGLSPLHAPTPVAPIAASPYYPSSRRWHSPLLLRVDEVPGGAAPEVQALAAPARALLDLPVVDRDRCWAQQRQALERLWADRSEDEEARLARWRAEQGDALDDWAVFCTLAEQHGPRWQTWPEALRHPRSPAVAAAATRHAERVGFHAWLQLLVADQLAAAQAVGPRLVQDLAVGVDPGGADAWRWQDLLAFDFTIGAPPDEFVPEGQRWGLPPWQPARLRDEGYRPLAALLRAGLGTGGGLRIDHVMGLERLFWVPEGGDPADGAYVRFPARHLLEVVALESARAGSLVVGEDLGTVEPGFRDHLRDAGIHSTRVVWFEADPPEAWPPLALGAVTTHDLPTLAGMVTGADSPPAMLARLERLVGPVTGRPPGAVAVDVHRRLGASGAGLVVATLEDALGVPERPNLPGTEHAENWSRALPVPIDDLAEHPLATRVLGALAGSRPD